VPQLIEPPAIECSTSTWFEKKRPRKLPTEPPEPMWISPFGAKMSPIQFELPPS
jgi:hypothetical protein